MLAIIHLNFIIKVLSTGTSRYEQALGPVVQSIVSSMSLLGQGFVKSNNSQYQLWQYFMLKNCIEFMQCKSFSKIFGKNGSDFFMYIKFENLTSSELTTL